MVAIHHFGRACTIWDSTSWCLALAKSDTAMLWPREYWDSLDAPLRFYGEVVHSNTHTQFGDTKCLLKVRAIAHLMADERI